MDNLSAWALVFLAPVLFFVGNANAGIILGNVGNDLKLEIDKPITFFVSSNVSTSRLGFTLPGAIDVAGTGGFSLTSDPATAPIFTGPGIPPDYPDVGLLRSGDDLEILYFLSSTVDLVVGDEVTLNPGELVLPGFFDFSIVQGLNYSLATEAILSESGGRPISAATSTMVPVPGTFLLLFGGLLILGSARRSR